MHNLKNNIKGLIRLIRKQSNKKMFWVGREQKCPNFGDLIGPYLFKKITGIDPIFSIPSNMSFTTVYLTVGSILFWCKENCVVWGSGIIYDGQNFPEPQKTLAVRGPITQKHFLMQNYNCPSVFGDPAILLPKYFKPTDLIATKKIGIIAHYVDKDICSKIYSNSDEVVLIDVFAPIEIVVKEILSCQHIVSSSLHGIIVAQAYGVPTGWIKFSDKLWGGDIKFNDYYSSCTDLKIKPLMVNARLSPSDLIKFTLDSFNPSSSIITNLQNGLMNSCPFI